MSFLQQGFKSQEFFSEQNHTSAHSEAQKLTDIPKTSLYYEKYFLHQFKNVYTFATTAMLQLPMVKQLFLQNRHTQMKYIPEK